MIYEGRKIEAFVLDRLTQLIKNSTCLDAGPSPWTCLWRLTRPCRSATMFCPWRIIIRPLLFSAWRPPPEYFNNQMRVLRTLPSPHENSYKRDARADGETKITGLLTWRQQARRGRPDEKARDLKRSDGNSKRGGEKKRELIPSGSCTSSQLTKTAHNVSHVGIRAPQSHFSGIIDCFQTRRKAKGQLTFWRKPPSSSSRRRRSTSSGVVWKTWPKSNKVVRSWGY